MSGLVGVIGGVGPLATAYFLDKVVRLTHAARDQDHVNLVVFQHAAIPDRTEFIVGASQTNPGPVMAEDARRLEAFGAEFLVLPCNTAHRFTSEIASAVSIELVSIVAVTIDEAQRREPNLERVGVLATTGTVSAGEYQSALASRGLASLVPDDDDQSALMRVIYEQVKAGLPADVEVVRAVADRLVARGAQAVVLGCTELSVVAQDAGLLAEPLYVDSLDVLARATIVRAGKAVRAG